MYIVVLFQDSWEPLQFNEKVALSQTKSPRTERTQKPEQNAAALRDPQEPAYYPRKTEMIEKTNERSKGICTTTRHRSSPESKCPV